ncbi:SMODS domain-containing nucleotidyltransferase [Streptomyces sp. NPDC054808]
MAVTVHRAFDEFKKWLKVDGTELGLVNSRPASIKSYLGGAFNEDSNMPLVNTALMGSATRDTIIHPVDDVDVFAQFSASKGAWDRYRNDSKAFIYHVREALSGYRVEIVGTRGQVVRLFYASGPHVEIAPVFASSTGGFLLPDGSGGWLTTDPPRQTDWINQRHSAIQGDLRGLIRLVKAWNRAHGAYFKSFHLEVLVATAVTSLDNNSRTALRDLFGAARYYLNVRDPAGHSGDLSGYMTATRRSNALTALDAAAERAQRAVDAENRGDLQEAIRLWRINLGSGFPTYG